MTKAIRWWLLSLVLALGLAGCEDQEPQSRKTQKSAPARPGISPDGGGFAPLAAAKGAAVVNIGTSRRATQESPAVPEPFRGTPFEELFERFFGAPPEREPRTRPLGSGFIVASDGYVVTNAHVVAKAREVVVGLSDRRTLPAEVVGVDEVTDLALLKVAAADLPTVTFAKGNGVAVGEWVVAMGAPFGFGNSVTAGIVSAKGRDLPGESGSYVPYLQTDVAINPGNSGGPLFNQDGRVVGVNARIYSRSGGYMGLSFAIPASLARDVIAGLKADGDVRHGWLGVGMQEVDRDLAASLGLDRPRGAIVTRVVEDSPAAAAGLETGDIIIAVGGRDIERASQVPPLLGRREPGSTIELHLIRGGERFRREVTLGALAERD